MNWKDYIIADTEILVGKPVIKGTRLSVDIIIPLLSQGWSEQQIFENYPQVTPDALRAMFAFVRECLADEEFIERPELFSLSLTIGLQINPILV